MKSSGRLASLGLLAASLLIALGASEVATRIFARVGGGVGASLAAADPMAVKVRPHGHFGYRQRPGAAFPYPSTRAVAHANALGYRGPEVADRKPAGTVRVILLGESSTHGYGVADHRTIDAYLRKDLARRFPDRRVEVVNLAFDGYDAYQIWQRLLSDGLPREPDLVIVNTGVNDVRNARYPNLSGDPDPRTLLWESEIRRLRAEEERGRATAWTYAKHWLFLARIPGIVRLRRQAGANESSILRTPVFPDAIPYFERNISRIADTLARAGVPLLLSTAPSALMMPGVTVKMAPRGYWVVDRATTQRYRDSLTTRMRAVENRLRRADAAVAYVPHALSRSMFLDDCHLTAAGNRQMAADFANAAAPFLARPR